MVKRLTGLLIALMVLGISWGALAAAPSKTTEDLVSVEETVTADGEVLSALIWVKEEQSEVAEEQLLAITEFVGQANPVATYFPQDVQEQIAERLPEGIDPSMLVMNEFLNIGIGEYLEQYGDIEATFLFPTEYRQDQTIVPVIGYQNEEGEIVWQTLDTQVIDGMLQIVLPKELMMTIGHDAMLAILSI